MANTSPALQTHYNALGLVTSASPEVIRAAYKALALIHHPDKTLHLPAEERASHAATFRTVQEAWDVLANPTSKAAYDAELGRHGNEVDVQRSTFHRPATPCSRTSSTPKRQHSIRLTTPEEKQARRAKAEQDLAYLHEQRTKRNAEDAKMDVGGLRFMVNIWAELGEEHCNDALLRAHCAIRIWEYEQKILEHEKRQEDWLDNLSKPKNASSTSTSHNNRSSTSMATKPAPASQTFTSGAPIPTRGSYHLDARAEARQRAENERAEQDALRVQSRAEERARKNALKQSQLDAKVAAAHSAKASVNNKANDLARDLAREANLRAQARADEKARKHAAKQAHLDAKAAAVRSGKEKLKIKAEGAARVEAERIARVRAKAGAPPLGKFGAGSEGRRTPGPSEPSRTSEPAKNIEPELGDSKVARPWTKKACGRCGAEHASFAEWRKCNMQTAAREATSEESDPFFYVV